VKFLVDRCAGRRLAEWLRGQGHDVLESRERGDDPGDDAILQWAASENRIRVTMDKDLGLSCSRSSRFTLDWSGYPTFPRNVESS
jgi:predicted nuclease of predicted toxin-antitoxin system